MKRLFLGALALGVAALFPARAMAEDVIVVDFARVAAESSAGKDMESKLKALADSLSAPMKAEQNAMSAEFKSVETQMLASNPALKQRIDALRGKLQGASGVDARQAQEAESLEIEFQRLAAEQAQKNPQLKTRLEALSKRTGALQVKQREATLKWRQTAAAYNRDYEPALGGAVKDVMTARKAVIALDEGAAFAHANSVDATSDVIAALNKRKTSVTAVAASR